MTPIGRNAQYLRRKKIAAYVKARGGTPDAINDACGEFEVSVSTVRNACREFGTKLLRLNNLRTLDCGTYPLIADLCNTDDTFEEIGERHKVTKQRVSSVYRSCVRAGVPVRRRAKGRKKK